MCYCAELGSWGPRHEVDAGAHRLLQLEQIFYCDQSWESIYRCKDCQQLWHEEFYCGHANIEHIGKVDAKGAAKITKKLMHDRAMRQAEDDIKEAVWLAGRAERDAAALVVTPVETVSMGRRWESSTRSISETIWKLFRLRRE